MSQSLHLAVRTLHVLGMAVLVGGAAGVWIAARRSIGDRTDIARSYEWAFWAALGVMLVTGIGNLGALGAPGPATDWGQLLLAKLSLVTVLVLASMVRTLAVVRTDETVSPTRLAAFHERAYGLTTLALLALVVLAEVLAHG